MENILQKTRNYVQEKMQNNDPGHDYLHVQRVVLLSKEIAEHESDVNMFVCEMIALLHDMYDDKLKSNMSIDALSNFLDIILVPTLDKEKILEGISYISFRKYPYQNPTFPIEVQIVQDADRIDAIGAIGIARTFSYGGVHHRTFYGEENSTIAHFEEKLLLLYDRLNTAHAKKIAKERHTFLQAFYQQFLKETQ